MRAEPMETTPSPPETEHGVLHRDLVEQLPDGVAVLDGERIRYANRAFRRILGREGEEIEGASFADFLEPEDRDALRARLGTILAGGDPPPPLAARIDRKDGEAVDVEFLLYRTHLGGDPATAVVLHDATARLRAQERLRISELSYRQLFEGAPEAIYVQDENGVFLDVNEHAIEMYGYEKEFFVGRTPLALSAPGKNDLEAVGALVARAFAGETHRFEFWGVRRDGSVFPKEVLVTPGTYFGMPVVIAFSRDITERRALEEGLLHAQKLQAVGRLAGGVAHDFSNILQAVTSHVDLALSGPGDTRSLRRHLDSIREATDRASAVVRQLLAFARRQVLERERLDLNEVVTGVLDMLSQLVRKGISIEQDPASEPLLVSADAGQIEQVLTNLVVNASDAIDSAGTITIRTRLQAADDTFRATRPWAEADAYAVLSVTDTGTGIPPEIREALFEPFFTTKEPGKGTGLGLAMVHGIVSQHGGGIDVESPLAGGATFLVYLPVDAR